MMNVLAIEGYYGGSHRAFLDGWTACSGHAWTLLTLPPNKWKWRMRHGAITFARQVERLAGEGGRWDVLFCSDMLNLAEFVGLVGESAQRLPRVVYFHENQLTYPVRVESERDYQYVMTNLTTCLAAEAVWFNSAFHRDEFLGAMGAFLKRMPDNRPLDAVDTIAARSEVHPPGIEAFAPRGPRRPGPLHILWAARWEHDKNPEDFFAAMKILKEKGIDFRLSVIGERFRDVPEVFAWAKGYFAQHIVRWGFQESRDAYRTALCEADVVVSTANHEFFGITIVEAIAAGAMPVLPKRLAYPEIISVLDPTSPQDHFYNGTIDDLAGRLADFSRKLAAGGAGEACGLLAERTMAQYGWAHLGPTMDSALTRQIA